MRQLVPSMLACVLLAAACTASSPSALPGQEELLVLEVAPASVSCVGEMATRCIRVRGPGEQDWRTFYDPIEGFRYEEGVRYTLEVARRAVPNPPADGSAYAYRLVRVIDRDPPAA